MCGILGILTSPEHVSRLTQTDWLAMRDCMATRGLSGSSLVQRNQVVLATRNFAGTAAGETAQPVFSANGRFGLVFDGQIVQLDALRDHLERVGFRCQQESTAAVLLKAWLAWGKSFVRKISGAFAIAIVDLQENCCHLIRDRVGAKPLYYAQIGGECIFASSIKAFRRHPDFSATPNLSAIRHYLSTLRLTLDDQTLLQKIHTVLPAEIVTLGFDRRQREIYWSPEQPVVGCVRYSDAIEELTDHLRTATEQALQGLQGHRIGTVLSGGVDSSLMASLAATHIDQPLVSRCGAIGDHPSQGDQTDSDLHFSEKFSRERKLEHRSVILSQELFFDNWQSLVREYESPLATPSDVMLYQVARSFKGEVSALLAAEGADEVFCGYSIPHWAGRDYEHSMTLSRVQSREAEQTRASLKLQYGRDQFYSPSDHFLLTSGLIPRNTLATLLRPEHWPAADDQRSLERYYDGLFAVHQDRPMVEQFAHVLFQINTENLVSRLDRATAQAGIQVRLPYTDHRLIEFAFRLPHHFKIDLNPNERQPWLSSMELNARHSIRSKRILRSAAEQQIAGEFAGRPKQSAPSQVPSWLAGTWKPWVRQTLNQSSFFQQLFDPSAVEELQTLPDQLSMWNWPIINLALWGDQVF